MNFGQQVISYHFGLKPNWKIPKEFSLIYPFENESTRTVFKLFYDKYFSDRKERRFLFGINPGRFGAGVTGVPFTDPFYLKEKCGIVHPFNIRKELSAIFIYDLIEMMGGLEAFYSQFYITSLCPLGFLKDNKNANYYDDKDLLSSVKKKIISNIKSQIKFGCDKTVAYSLGKGKNYKFFKLLNDEHQFFDSIIALPHPRWVMQYKLKEKNQHLTFIKDQLLVT